MSLYAHGTGVIELIQRISEAAARAGGHVIDEVGPSLLALVYAGHGDITVEADRPLGKLLNYRVFSDAQGKMSLPVRNIDGNGRANGLLVVSQFTLVADTKSGTRPNFMPAAAPGDRHRLYEHFVACACARYPIVAAGEFGVDMKVSLVDDGPVTPWLQITLQATASIAKTATPEAAKSVWFIQEP